LTIFVSPQSLPALVLNADYRPLSYYPLSLWSWQDAVKAVFLDRVQIVAEYDQAVSSPSFSMRLPSVVCLKNLHISRRGIRPSPGLIVFLRDRFECQYCGSPNELTFDHVIPRRCGGETTWQNVVAACSPCNLKKGGVMPKEAGMIPQQKPYRPSVQDLHNNGRMFPPNFLHESWMDYLYWDVELQP
jgi:5-methylcytosine-specific restriction endonuclease McrA